MFVLVLKRVTECFTVFKCLYGQTNSYFDLIQDSKLIEQFKTDNKSKVKDFKNHLNLQKLTKKEIRARLEFLKLKRKGTKSEQDWYI